MPRPARTSFPQEFAGVRQEFDTWRASGTRHRKLPDRLWEQAVLLARKHGLNRTKSALGLDYYSLKRRVEKSGGQAAMSPPKPALGHSFQRKSVLKRRVPRKQAATDSCRSDFIELPGSFPVQALPSASECVIEFKRVSGALLRIEWKGNHPPDLVALGKQFWSGR
jgi:hypothetical protein